MNASKQPNGSPQRAARFAKCKITARNAGLQNAMMRLVRLFAIRSVFSGTIALNVHYSVSRIYWRNGIEKSMLLATGIHKLLILP